MKRKFLGRLILFMLMFCFIAENVTHASEQKKIDTGEGIITSVVSDENYDGWTLQWEYEADYYDLLVGIEKDEAKIEYIYDENHNRIRKLYNDNVIIFAYNDNGELIREENENGIIEYIYMNMTKKYVQDVCPALFIMELDMIINIQRIL